MFEYAHNQVVSSMMDGLPEVAFYWGMLLLRIARKAQ